MKTKQIYRNKKYIYIRRIYINGSKIFYKLIFKKSVNKRNYVSISNEKYC